MRKNLYLVFFICVSGLFFNSISLASQERCYKDMTEVLDCFMQHKDDAYRYEFMSENKDNPDVRVITYVLYSQKWPIEKNEHIPKAKYIRLYAASYPHPVRFENSSR